MMRLFHRLGKRIRVIVVILLVYFCTLSYSKNHNKTENDHSCPGIGKIECKDGIMIPAWLTPGNATGTALTAAKAFVYIIAMFFMFLGISIISDRFMASIEIITSQERTLQLKIR